VTAPDAVIIREEEADLDVSKPEHDLGEVVQHDELRHSFKVTNPRSRPLVILVQTATYCSGVATPRTLEPGQQGTIDVICVAKDYGPFLGGVIVFFRNKNDPPIAGREISLTVKAQVKPAAIFDRDLITANMPFGENRVEEVRVIGARADKVRLSKPRIEVLSAPEQAMKSRKLGMHFEILPPRQGKTAGLRIRLKASAVGVYNGRIIVNTGLDRPTEASLAFTITVTGTLQITPEVVHFNMLEPGVKSRVIDIKSTQPNFALLSVKPLRGAVETAIENGPSPGHYRVKLTLRNETPDSEGVLGKIRIVTNDPAEPVRELPLKIFDLHQH
jgi:hypothetical protein